MWSYEWILGGIYVLVALICTGVLLVRRHRPPIRQLQMGAGFVTIISTLVNTAFFAIVLLDSTLELPYPLILFAVHLLAPLHYFPLVLRSCRLLFLYHCQASVTLHKRFDGVSAGAKHKGPGTPWGARSLETPRVKTQLINVRPDSQRRAFLGVTPGSPSVGTAAATATGAGTSSTSGLHTAQRGSSPRSRPALTISIVADYQAFARTTGPTEPGTAVSAHSASPRTVPRSATLLTEEASSPPSRARLGTHSQSSSRGGFAASPAMPARRRLAATLTQPAAAPGPSTLVESITSLDSVTTANANAAAAAPAQAPPPAANVSLAPPTDSRPRQHSLTRFKSAPHVLRVMNTHTSGESSPRSRLSRTKSNTADTRGNTQEPPSPAITTSLFAPDNGGNPSLYPSSPFPTGSEPDSALSSPAPGITASFTFPVTASGALPAPALMIAAEHSSNPPSQTSSPRSFPRSVGMRLNGDGVQPTAAQDGLPGQLPASGAAAGVSGSPHSTHGTIPLARKLSHSQVSQSRSRLPIHNAPDRELSRGGASPGSVARQAVVEEGEDTATGTGTGTGTLTGGTFVRKMSQGSPRPGSMYPSERILTGGFRARAGSDSKMFTADGTSGSPPTTHRSINQHHSHRWPPNSERRPSLVEPPPSVRLSAKQEKEALKTSLEGVQHDLLARDRTTWLVAHKRYNTNTSLCKTWLVIIALHCIYPVVLVLTRDHEDEKDQELYAETIYHICILGVYIAVLGVLLVAILRTGQRFLFRFELLFTLLLWACAPALYLAVRLADDELYHRFQQRLDLHHAMAIYCVAHMFFSVILPLIASCRPNRVAAISPHQSGPSTRFDTLERILEHPLGLRYFSKFLVTNLAIENLVFWEAVERYRQLGDARERAALGRLIIRDCFTGDERTQCPQFGVNVSDSEAREMLAIACPGPDDPNPPAFPVDLFDRCQAAVFGMMKQDTAPRFFRSKHYQHLLQKIAEADAEVRRCGLETVPSVSESAPQLQTPPPAMIRNTSTHDKTSNDTVSVPLSSPV